MAKFASDNSIDQEHEQEKTGLQIFIDYIRENYPAISKIELSNNRAIYFNDKTANNKYVSISPTSLCLLTYNMDYYVDIEGFTCDDYNLISHHNKIIIFNTVDFFEYIVGCKNILHPNATAKDSNYIIDLHPSFRNGKEEVYNNLSLGGIQHYKFEDSYTNIIKSILTKSEYIGLNEIQPIIYILFKKGYYNWLDNIVSYIAIKNRLQRDYNIDYELEL
jgi:hypothetical protein